MSWASVGPSVGTSSASISSVSPVGAILVVLTVLTAASACSGPASPAPPGQGRNLCGLVLLGEGWEGFVKGWCCSVYGRHLYLLGGQKDLIGRLKNLLVGVTGEDSVADVGADTDRELDGPQGLGCCWAATAHQLLWLLANVVHNLITQLGR